MLLNIIVIVLREILEASILIAVLLSACRHQGTALTWLPVALLLGALGACLYGWQLHSISRWFDDTGQELVNAAMQLLLYLTIGLTVALQWARPAAHPTTPMLMAAMVITAIVREGGEIYVFLLGFLQNEQVLLQTLTSIFISLCIGLSTGALVYYLLTGLSKQAARRAHALTLTLIGAGMALQATQLLIQADWLAATEPLWDSSGWLAEGSAAGQLAYAIMGYEATPSPIEVLVYWSAIGLIGLTALAASIGIRPTNSGATKETHCP